MPRSERTSPVFHVVRLRMGVFLLLACGLALLRFLAAPHLAGVPDAELLFLLAFHTALHGPAETIVPGFFLCGLLRDAALGVRLGPGALLYVLAALPVAGARGYVSRDHLLTRAGYPFAALLCIRLVRILLEEGAAPATGWTEALASALAGAAATAVVGPFVGLLLETRLLRPWREESL